MVNMTNTANEMRIDSGNAIPTNTHTKNKKNIKITPLKITP